MQIMRVWNIPHCPLCNTRGWSCCSLGTVPHNARVSPGRIWKIAGSHAPGTHQSLTSLSCLEWQLMTRSMKKNWVSGYLCSLLNVAIKRDSRSSRLAPILQDERDLKILQCSGDKCLGGGPHTSYCVVQTLWLLEIPPSIKKKKIPLMYHWPSFCSLILQDSSVNPSSNNTLRIWKWIWTFCCYLNFLWSFSVPSNAPVLASRPLTILCIFLWAHSSFSEWCPHWTWYCWWSAQRGV